MRKKLENPITPSGSGEGDEEKEDEPESKLSRREFLKKSALAGGAAFFGGAYALSKDFMEGDAPEEALPARPVEELSDIPTTEMAESAEVERPVVFNIDKETHIDMETIDELKDYWKWRYSNREDMREELESALDLKEKSVSELLETWMDYMRKKAGQVPGGRIEDEMDIIENSVDIISSDWSVDEHARRAFQDEGVPEVFRHLAVVESHWLPDRSFAGALGPYQFTAPTAEHFDLEIDRAHGIDQRYDPVLSAKAAARLLDHNSSLTGDVWNLAIAAYNGPYVWKYMREHGKKNLSYEGFLSFLADEIEAIKEPIRSGSTVEHFVRRGHNLLSISRIYGVDVESIKEANGLETDAIRAGSRLDIPLASLAVRQRAVDYKTLGFRENLNYVPKFYAVAELMEEADSNALSFYSTPEGSQRLARADE